MWIGAAILVYYAHTIPYIIVVACVDLAPTVPYRISTDYRAWRILTRALKVHDTYILRLHISIFRALTGRRYSALAALACHAWLDCSSAPAIG